jgi:hypothetical protein
MKILESYLNEYKQADPPNRSTISNIMLKYIIGSCLKKNEISGLSLGFILYDWESA